MVHSVLTYLMLITFANGAGFDYPLTLPDPFGVQRQIFRIHPGVNEYETPIQIRDQSAQDTSFWNCVAIYHRTALDGITKQRPRVIVDDHTINMYGTSETRALCSIYAVFIVRKTVIPEDHSLSIQQMEEWGLNSSLIDGVHPDVANCDIDDVQCLQDVAEQNGFVPEIIGSIVAYEMLNFLQNDGWNADGSIGKHGKCECTANCNPYSDTTGYQPKPCKHYKRWQPLQENNGKGFFYHHHHVTPHIGKTAKLYTLSRRELNQLNTRNPNYKYNIEKQIVIDRLADLATNDTQKIMVEYYDNKLKVARDVFSTVGNRMEWSYEEAQLFLSGYSATEYDAIILSWKEKVKWDLIRPTTVIKRGGNKKITTYGGAFRGLKEIRSSDFEAYIRVMPHSEYPSASGCLCSAVARYSDRYLQDRQGILDDVPITLRPFGPFSFFPPGISIIEPGETPSTPLHIIASSFQEFSNWCGQSRLWGGLHFTEAVTESQRICPQIGDIGYQHIIHLLDAQPL